MVPSSVGRNVPSMRRSLRIYRKPQYLCAVERAPAFQAVTEGIAREIVSICGQDNVLRDEGAMARYSRDKVPEPRYHAMPELVAKPGSAAEIQAILRLANRERVPVTPRGAGSGLAGGAIPVFGGIVVSLERMNRILEIDRENQVAVVEPGVVTNALDQALEPTGLFFAGYPLSEEICFIGGNVAHNAGGGRAVKYGVTRRYVTGLEVVTATGQLVTLGGKRFKDATGYDLVGLMVGSEGTLGIFTKMTIRLLPRPAYRRSLLALFPEADAAAEDAAIRVAPDLVARGRLVPSAIEFMDGTCLREACRALRETLPWQQAGAALLLESDGQEEGTVSAELRAMEDACRGHGASVVLTAGDEADWRRHWKIRKQVPWVLRGLAAHTSIEDLSVPVGEVRALVGAIRGLERTWRVRIPTFGHLGDGNLHAHPLGDPSAPEGAWDEMLPLLLADLYRAASGLGGTISGEHGIGSKRKDFLPLVMSPEQIGMLAAIKGAFDPNGILNPGKIVDPAPWTGAPSAR